MFWVRWGGSGCRQHLWSTFSRAGSSDLPWREAGAKDWTFVWFVLRKWVSDKHQTDSNILVVHHLSPRSWWSRSSPPARRCSSGVRPGWGSPPGRPPAASRRGASAAPSPWPPSTPGAWCWAAPASAACWGCASSPPPGSPRSAGPTRGPPAGRRRRTRRYPGTPCAPPPRCRAQRCSGWRGRKPRRVLVGGDSYSFSVRGGVG